MGMRKLALSIIEFHNPCFHRPYNVVMLLDKFRFNILRMLSEFGQPDVSLFSLGTVAFHFKGSLFKGKLIHKRWSKHKIILTLGAQIPQNILESSLSPNWTKRVKGTKFWFSAFPIKKQL
jgi:hypothetical protein